MTRRRPMTVRRLMLKLMKLPPNAIVAISGGGEQGDMWTNVESVGLLTLPIGERAYQLQYVDGGLRKPVVVIE